MWTDEVRKECGAIPAEDWIAVACDGSKVIAHGSSILGVCEEARGICGDDFFLVKNPQALERPLYLMSSGISDGQASEEIAEIFRQQAKGLQKTLEVLEEASRVPPELLQSKITI